MIDPMVQQCGEDYARLCGITLDLNSPLGSGTDGAVWKSDRDTAVKALCRQHNYTQELTCYRRFAAAGVTEIDGFSIAKLINWSDDLWIIEMGIVKPPFIVDFAKVSIDKPPDFSVEVLEEEEQSAQERFEHRWPEVQSLLASLKYRFHIYYQDPKPGNIMFKDWPDLEPNGD
jgi:hypothetical protein